MSSKRIKRAGYTARKRSDVKADMLRSGALTPVDCRDDKSVLPNLSGRMYGIQSGTYVQFNDVTHKMDADRKRKDERKANASFYRSGEDDRLMHITGKFDTFAKGPSVSEMDDIERHITSGEDKVSLPMRSKPRKIKGRTDVPDTLDGAVDRLIAGITSCDERIAFVRAAAMVADIKHEHGKRDGTDKTRRKNINFDRTRDEWTLADRIAWADVDSAAPIAPVVRSAGAPVVAAAPTVVAAAPTAGPAGPALIRSAGRRPVRRAGAPALPVRSAGPVRKSPVGPLRSTPTRGPAIIDGTDRPEHVRTARFGPVASFRMVDGKKVPTV